MSLLSHDQRGQVTQCNRKLSRKRQRDVAKTSREKFSWEYTLFLWNKFIFFFQKNIVTTTSGLNYVWGYVRSLLWRLLRGGGNENVKKKSNRLNKQKKKNSALAQESDFFLSLNLDMAFRNSPQGELARISLHILLLIIALKCSLKNQRKETLFKGRLRRCRRRSILNSLFSHIPPRRLVHKICKYLWLFQSSNHLSCVLCRNW